MTVAAVILAASPDSALADADGLPGVRRIADAAWSGGATPIVVVSFDPDGMVAAALAGAPVTLAEPAPADGGPAAQMARGADVARAAYSLLKHGGRLELIIRADRAVEVLLTLKESRLEPKRIRLVCPSVDRSPNLMLTEATRGGNPGVRWEPPLIVYGPDGGYTEELQAIYGRAEV
jgi:hypothetical protein